MDAKLTQLFQQLSDNGPAIGLEALILRRIAEEKRRQERRRLDTYRAGLVLSSAATAWVAWAFGGAFLNSEFLRMLSLVFSDLQTVAQNWNDFSLSLLETLPAVTLAALLVPLFILFWLTSAYLELQRKNCHKYV